MNNIDRVLDLLENELPSIDSKFRCINNGGCGFMAEIIAEQLDKLSINYDIICRGGWRCNGKMTNEQVNNLIDEEDSSSIPNSHVLIMVNGRIFDSEGEQYVNDESRTALIDHKTINRMLDMDCWNSTFNRNQVAGMRAYAQSVFYAVFGEVA